MDVTLTAAPALAPGGAPPPGAGAATPPRAEGGGAAAGHASSHSFADTLAAVTDVAERPKDHNSSSKTSAPTQAVPAVSVPPDATQPGLAPGWGAASGTGGKSSGKATGTGTPGTAAQSSDDEHKGEASAIDLAAAAAAAAAVAVPAGVPPAGAGDKNGAAPQGDPAKATSSQAGAAATHARGASLSRTVTSAVRAATNAGATGVPPAGAGDKNGAAPQGDSAKATSAQAGATPTHTSTASLSRTVTSAVRAATTAGEAGVPPAAAGRGQPGVPATGASANQTAAAGATTAADGHVAGHPSPARPGVPGTPLQQAATGRLAAGSAPAAPTPGSSGAPGVPRAGAAADPSGHAPAASLATAGSPSAETRAVLAQLASASAQPRSPANVPGTPAGQTTPLDSLRGAVLHQLDASTDGKAASGDGRGARTPTSQAQAQMIAAVRDTALLFGFGSGLAAPRTAAPVLLNGTPAFTTALDAATLGGGLPASTAAQIVQAIRLQWGQGGGEATIRLQPQQFGDLSVSLRVDQGQVVARLEASTPIVREWLQANQATLQHGLAEHNLTLDRLEVTEPQPSPHGDRRGDQPSREQPPPQRRRRPTPAGTFEVVA